MPVQELALGRKIGGTENPKGARLRPGSRGAMREKEGSRLRLVADACHGSAEIQFHRTGSKSAVVLAFAFG
jgi:hypothetical protein